jgi:predicted MFS family arabinose efflux permease
LGLALGLDVGVTEAGLDLAGPIGGVAVDAGSLVITWLGIVGHWLLGAAAVLDCGSRDR